MKRFALIVVLAACGPKAKGPAAPTGFQTAPEYASLFAKDAAWTFAVESDDDTVSETSETGFEHQHASSETICRVTGVGEFDGGVASRIECDALETSGMTDPLSGLWIADANGVYRVGDGVLPAAGEKPPYGKDNLIFAVPPAERSEEQFDEESQAPSGDLSVTRSGEAWCYSWATSMGDPAWETLCVDPLGPVNGSFGYSGGENHEATFQRKP
jgi:hypothetical protein